MCRVGMEGPACLLSEPLATRWGLELEWKVQPESPEWGQKTQVLFVTNSIRDDDDGNTISEQ